MKLRLITCTIAISSISTIFTGGYFSLEQKPKVKIAHALILRDRANKEKNIAGSFEQYLFIDMFQDKKIPISDIPAKIDAFFLYAWTKRVEVSRKDTARAFDLVRDTLKSDYDKQVSIMKPELFRILLQDDYPNILAQIPEYQTALENQTLQE